MVTGVRLVAPLSTPSHQPITPAPPKNSTPPLFVFLKSQSAERRAPACPPPPTNPWLTAIGGTQSGVLMLQLGEETLVNLPIACHWPWPGLFVSGTPLISPSTPSSVFPPSFPTQFLYPKMVSSFLKDLSLPLRMSDWIHCLSLHLLTQIRLFWQTPFAFLWMNLTTLPSRSVSKCFYFVPTHKCNLREKCCSIFS